ncbi:hypothetical protein [Candidatus Nitrosopumilus sediminis]|uniref:hypothetical protein n=1 Tax=Candidatus Nitrosopumilus sediminis TaxID=1229909 RepID=UPI00036AFDE2|nr:hypothetical protein [Candidatus Nitrosopumilus sediminis]
MMRYLLIVLILLSGVYLNSESFAQSNGCPEKPFTYEMGLKLETIGEIKKSTGSYELIFWLSLTSDEINFLECPPPKEWDFTNGYVINTYGTSTTEHFHKTQIHGIFFEDNDYKDYPFENMVLTVHIEPFFPLTAEDIVFEINEENSGINFSTITVPGWEIDVPTFETRIDSYPWADFPHYKATFPIDTEPFSIFVKKLLPPLVLASFGFATLFMSSTTLQNRITIVGTGMTASIFFHAVFLLGELPPLGYLTLADKIMISIYSVFGNALLALLLHQRHMNTIVGIEHKEYELKEQLATDRKMMIVTPVVAVVIFFVLYFV